MRAVSSTYKSIIASGETRLFHVRINMTLADETALVLTDSDIMSGTFEMESASSGESSFDIGSAIIGMCKFSLENFDERFTQYDFFNATATVWLKLEGDSEYIRIGFYTVDEPKYNGGIVSLELIDNMWKFDKPIPAMSFPITCGAAVNALCLECGVTLATQQFRGYDYTLTVAPEQEMNCREMLQYIAMICCRFCDMDDTGALRLRWYDRGSRPEDSLDGGTFNTNTTPYSDGDTADGGNFTNYYSGDDYDGGDFIDSENVDWFTRNFNVSLGTDEITITGIKFTIDEVDYQLGEDGYVLVLENPLVNASNVNSVLNYIWEVLEDFRFRTYNLDTLPDISAEIGDCCAIKDIKENIVCSYITNIMFKLTAQTVQFNAVTPTRKLSTTYSKTLQIAVEEAKKKTEAAISRYDVAVQLMNNLSVNAMGAYQDYEDLETGGRVYYLSNRPITKVNNHCSFVEDSTVFKATGDGFFVSTHGGQEGTWENGYDPTTGTLLVNVLKAIGVSADWVETGLLTDRGHYNYWDLDNNIFRLSATTTVGGKTVDAIAQEKADAAEQAAENTAAAALAAQVAIYDADIADLQNQIDGNVTTWYYSGTPTLNNLPASQWTTTTDKDNHIGDIYYDSATGYAYRFMKDGNNYIWTKISDEDIAAALAVAQEAQDTADNKRRIFITEPVPPYDEGDTWMMGTTGDIKTCIHSKTSSEAYDSSDWSKLNKYTDDSALNSFKNGDYAQFVTNTNNAIDGKITTFYQTSAPTAVAVGDLWIDTDDGNKLYRWNGTSWTSVQDNGIQSALTAASNAQTTADGKIVTFAQTSAPTATDVGDLWIDTDDNNKMYRWNGSSWVALSDSSSLVAWVSATYTTDKTNLQNQIDGKAETWYQANDPSTNWSASEKTKHTGDLWYKTSDDTTWYYTGTQWVQQNVPTAVFDKIDGKAQIFTSTPTTPYHVGDLWCEGNTGDILTCTHGKTSGSYDATDWEKRNKYTDDTAVTDLDNSLTQQNVFDRLTDNGRTMGIYLTADPTDPTKKLLMINANYIQTGQINANLIKAGVISDSQGNFSLNMTDGSLTMNSGMFKGQINVNNMFTVDSSGNINAKAGTIGDLTLASGELYKNGTRVLLSDSVFYARNRTTDKTYTLLTFNTTALGVKGTASLQLRHWLIPSGQYTSPYVALQRKSGNSWYDVASIYVVYSTEWVDSYIYNINFNEDADYRVIMIVFANSGTFTLNYGFKLANATLVSLSGTGISGQFRGTFSGLLDCQSGGRIGNFNVFENTLSTESEELEPDLYSGGSTAHLSPERISIYDADDDEGFSVLSGYSVELYKDSYYAYLRMEIQANNNRPRIYALANGTTYQVTFSSSDRRFKHDIEPLDTELSIKLIDGTETKSFVYNGDEGKHYGVIAQEARELLDSLGETDAMLEHSMGVDNPDVTDPRTIDYHEYIPHLINYVKELKSEINELKAELNKLKEEK